MKAVIEIYSVEQSTAKIFDDQVLAFAAAQAMRRMDKYVPYRTGILAQSARQKDNQIIYDTPYAYAIWRGLSPSGRPYQYRTENHPLATSQWHDAMMAAEGDALIREINRFISGR